MIKARQQLIIESYNEEENFRKIKCILEMERDGIIMFNTEELLYFNKGIVAILEKFNVYTGCTIENVFACARTRLTGCSVKWSFLRKAARAFVGPAFSVPVRF
eukprot:TRINITY_DN12245_c0_g1_i1.p3 TRINITY_DN12245_c0_g1~~TRINITY_DN12245_c0_g1_i1.p3  ORF type:complete len:103 (-),score=11.11 TRINITY_DN12245_c0_g1_i1:754-1062(-)